MFAEIERRADLDAWVEPHSLAGSTFLCPDSLTTDLDELLVQKKGSVHGMPMILRAGIDNCNLGWSLHTQAGYPGYALEVFSLSRVDLDNSPIVYPGAALGGETYRRLYGMLQTTSLWDTVQRLNLRVVLVLDFHGVDVLFSGRDDEERPVHNAECTVTGLPLTTPPGDPRLTDPPFLRPPPIVMQTLGKSWNGDPDLTAAAVGPGFWHSCGTLSTNLAMAEGRWLEIKTALERAGPNTVMNEAMSISGVEAVQQKRLTAAAQGWFDNAGLSALFNAETAPAVIEAADVIHRRFWASGDRAKWTAGCMAIYATAARCRILDPGPGRVAPWREKICERAHQGIKSNVSKSRHMLRWALARARHGERKRVTE